MKKKITTVLLTFAIAITGINTPADKVNAETKEAKTTTSETETVAPTATPAPVIGDVRGNSDDTYEIYNGTGWEKLVRYGDSIYYDWSGGSVYQYNGGWAEPPIGSGRNIGGGLDTMETYTENGWQKKVWKIGDCVGNMRYTIYGWLSFDDERYDEAIEAQIAAAKAEKAKKPHDIRIDVRDKSREENTTMLKDGGMAEITKGFDTKLSFKATGDTAPNWTSSNPEVVAITKTTQNKDKKTAVLTGKNYGTSVVTAEYNGSKISITIKVMKNEYKGSCNGIENHTYRQKNKGLSHKCKNYAEVKYNKKGNLVIKYTHKTYKWKNRKEKRKIVYKGKPQVIINDAKGKKVIDNHFGKFKMTVSPKKPNGKFTVTIPKKYLKKPLDLRNCSYSIFILGKYADNNVRK